MLVVCTHKELHTKRWELFKKLNGDVFWPMCQWPRKFRRIIWKKPLNDKETFQVALFLLGNGCSNFVVVEWILISQLMWTVNPKIWEKRARQLEFIIKNIDQRKKLCCLLLQNILIGLGFPTNLEKFVIQSLKFRPCNLFLIRLKTHCYTTFIHD